MKSTSRLRVLSDRIPRVLVFVYFCRGSSGNKEERPTCRDYIEISTHPAIFYHLEDSRSHGKEAEAKWGQDLGARPPPLGARPGQELDQDSASGLNSTDLKDQSKPHNQCRFDLTAHIHLKRLYNPGLPPWRREEKSLFRGSHQS